MPAMIAQPGMPVWLDLASTDAVKSEKFYGELLGWEFESLADGYSVAKKQGMPVAGIAQIPEGNQSVWGVLLYTPDVKKAHDKAVQAGAKSVLEPQDLGERGDMAVLIDPSGATIGLRNPADEHALIAAGEPGTPVWFELMVAQNWETTLEFYHELAGWDIKAAGTDDFRYATGEFDGAAVVGLWDTSALEVPGMWTVYLGVANVDDAVANTPELGGKVVRPAWESEFGRMATIEDPTGALVNLCEIEEFVPDEDAHEPDLLAPENFQAF
ncbi:VOC family protein [Corynebacterium sp. c9Ua_112]|uniref:VOC family protein n=1 Tax=Corynebacterium macclintockiae TaxID=2913501 RepID=A0A9X3M7L6_9CORY|nr:VOC family protein [Corynebacterium macclintockiae]MCZ9305640.1 VOC family protein [Corynebacterium macclintockiae]